MEIPPKKQLFFRDTQEAKLSTEYETEQRELTNKAVEMQQEVYLFVKRIIVHAPDKSSGKRVQKVDIVWNFIGMVDFPNEPQGKEAKEKTA